MLVLAKIFLYSDFHCFADSISHVRYSLSLEQNICIEIQKKSTNLKKKEKNQEKAGEFKVLYLSFQLQNMSCVYRMANLITRTGCSTSNG